ncbi:hypothetical protein J6590_093465 [Homalodisca vitripennis]|nr:hypothetical protein J6590_093465 [Homalodisca vitripennis]
MGAARLDLQLSKTTNVSSCYVPAAKILHWFQIILRQEEESCEEADERVHGVGAGGKAQASGPVSAASQRTAQQDVGSTMEESRVSLPKRILFLHLDLVRDPLESQLPVPYLIKPILFYALFCPSSWVTGLYEDIIKQDKGESRYSTRSMGLIKSARATGRIRTCAISNSDPKSNI